MSSPLLWFGNFAKFLKSGFILPGSTSGQVTVQAPSAITNYTVTLPNAQGGNGTVPTNDGSGNLSWSTPGVTPANMSSVQSLTQKLSNERYNIITPPIIDSFGSGFSSPPSSSYYNGVLLQQYPGSGTSATVVWSPMVLNPADPNGSTNTGWTAEGAGTLTLGAAYKIGTASQSLAKAGTATTAGIVYDAGSASLGVNGFTRLWFWVNLPSITNLTNIYVSIDIDGTNKQTWTLTTNYAGSALAVGDNLMFLDVSTGGTAGGTGWNPSLLFRFFHVGVTSSTSAQTYTGILFNGITFGLANLSANIVLGGMYTLYSATTRDNLTISSSNTQLDGPLTITTAMANTYNGGFGTYSGAQAGVILRSTVTVGSGQASFSTTDILGNTLAGAITLTQEERQNYVFRSALSSNQLSSVVGVNTSQNYTATSVTGSTIVIADPTNTSADLLSGDVVHVFRTVAQDGNVTYVRRGDMTLTSNSTALAGATTLNGTPPAGTSAGDTIIKKNLVTNLSVVSVGSNESFSAATPVASPNDVICYNVGIPIPNVANVVAYWSLGSPNATINTVGSLSNLITNGTISSTAPYLNGKFASQGFGALNYYYLTNTEASAIAGAGTNSVIAGSFWFWASSSLAVSSNLVSFQNGTTQGWQVLTSSGNTVEFATFPNSVPTTTTGGLYNTNSWNHVYFDSNSSGGNQNLWVNGVLVGTTATRGINTSSALFALGVATGSSGGNMDANSRLADVIMWVGKTLTAAQIQSIYNNGKSALLGMSPILEYQYADTVTGQSATLCSQITRHTTGPQIIMQLAGAIKTS